MDALELYRWMLVGRQFESALCARIPRWFPAEGEEAVIVGSFCGLREIDVAAPHYRGPFVVYLMRGADMKRLACQALGKAGGYNQGRSVPFTGPVERKLVPWVAGDLGTSIGVATGAALALRQQGQGVCICSFGDGTTNRGDFHENVNAAAVWKLPIVYVCQNNGWAISQHSSAYLPAPVVDRAAGYGIPGVVVDGSDVEAVRDAVAEAVGRAEARQGPSLIEARAQRKNGHWAADTAAYRAQLPAADPYVDPLALFVDRLLGRGLADDAGLRRLAAEVEAEVAAALDYAQAQEDAGPDQLGLTEVFA